MVLNLHKRLRGKIEIKPKMFINDTKDLSLVYTPHVAEVSKAIYDNKDLVYDYTSKWNNIAIVTDGSRLLGLGDLGGEAALPVMEGKSMLYKQFGNIDAYPICLSTKDKDAIIDIIKGITPSFAAINIEDIESPKCLEIVDALDIDLPIFHDDQHGTAVVTLAALINALKIVNKSLDAKIIVAGAGAAGYGIINLLHSYGFKNILALDSKGIITKENREDRYKRRIGSITNSEGIEGSLIDAIKDADVFIGVSGKPNLLTRDMIRLMNRDPIIFALSNPDPEITPEEADEARIIATGRSDYYNQVNNLLAFPFLMRMVLDKRIKKIDEELLLKYATMLSNATKSIDEKHILPHITDKNAIDSLIDMINSI
ncbi:MAG: NADP-dependent malic enzyme [Candidatus Nitrosothermus koennekii]|nr:MAG: NADP-dependent malic enzyme [Candidatus Nitrosothermus koennekii]